MSSPRPFPDLKQSAIRRLVSASVFKKATRLWEADAVVNPTVSTDETALFAHVRDARETCQVVVQHVAGDEFTSRCECDDDGLCAHATATLLAWTHAGYAFGRLETADDELTPDQQRREQWRAYLSTSSLAHLRAIARRHQIALRSSERAAMLEQLIASLSTPKAQQFALANLNEAQRHALEMVYLLSDGQPDTLAEDVHESLGWSSQSEVETVLRELSEWGLVVSVPSRWHGSDSFTLAPSAAALVSQLSAYPCDDTEHFAQPRNICVEPFTGDLTSACIVRRAGFIPELMMLARQLPLKPRAPQPELARARDIRALRHWPYDVDEVVQLQVNSGGFQQPNSAMSVPAPAARLDDESLIQLRALTADDALSEFVSQLLAATPDSTPSLQQTFAQWLQLTTWSELWLAQQEGAFVVKRPLVGTTFTYGEWLRQLARARRFVLRGLATLDAGTWYDYHTLLKFIFTIHADFLRDAPCASQPALWLDWNSAPVDPHDFDAWRASYGYFIAAVLRGPMLWFGAIALALAGDDLIAFQLTPLGEALLHERPLPMLTEPDAPLKISEGRACLPIGRDDISAYVTMEHIARFSEVRDGCACYQFSAESAHAAFESGMTADDALLQLEQLVRAPLPACLSAQWRDWWSRYAQVRWYDDLTLVEFADDYLLQELLIQTDLREHMLFAFGNRLIALRPESADAVARQLVKKGYMPKVE